MKTSCLAALALLWLPVCTLLAQFQIPLPRHIPPDSAFHIYSDACDRVREGQLDSIALDTLAVYTKRLATSTDSIRVTTSSCRNHWLTAADALHGVGKGNRAVRTIYGDSGINVLANLAGSFRKDRVYVQTAAVAGVIGPLYFNASYGQFFSSQESTEPGVSREELRDRTGNLLRLIQNGGSATIRGILPLVWGGGAASQQAADVYLNVGAAGPLGNSDSLRATVGLVVEGLATLAVRNVTTFDLDADLFLGVRPGIQVVMGHDGIIPESDSHTLPFIQVAGGIRIGGQPRVSVLLTGVPKKYSLYVPDVQFLFEVPRL
jgi:hypothetical protein